MRGAVLAIVRDARQPGERSRKASAQRELTSLKTYADELRNWAVASGRHQVRLTVVPTDRRHGEGLGAKTPDFLIEQVGPTGRVERIILADVKRLDGRHFDPARSDDLRKGVSQVLELRVDAAVRDRRGLVSIELYNVDGHGEEMAREMLQALPAVMTPLRARGVAVELLVMERRYLFIFNGTTWTRQDGAKLPQALGW